MAVTRSAELSVCCMTSGRSPARLADDPGAVRGRCRRDRRRRRGAASGHRACGRGARCRPCPVVSSCAPADRPIAWLFGACPRERGSFNIDDDEVPSPPAARACWPALDGPRGHLTRMDRPPLALPDEPIPTSTRRRGAPSFNSRLVLADDRFLQFSDAFHRPVIAHGPGVFVDAPPWHLIRRSVASSFDVARKRMRTSSSGRECRSGAARTTTPDCPSSVPNAALAVRPSDERRDDERRGRTGYLSCPHSLGRRAAPASS